MNALTIEGISKRYGAFVAVDEFSLTVPAGEVVGFLGPNGAGKTTTIRMIMSILYPDSGRIEVLGHARAVDVKDRIGYLPEERGLYRKMTVDQTLTYFGRLKSLHGPKLRERIRASLERVGLADWHNKKVETLSKGMSQKLQFVATILHQPELVILDEPFSGLDPLNTEMLQEMIFELRRAGVTVMLSTHQMEQAERMCDRLVLINRGRKLLDGTLDSVRGSLADRIVQIEGQGDFSRLASLDGVRVMRTTANHARLEIAEQVDPNQLLREALGHVRISRFEIQAPTLHEIFVKLVEADAGPDRGPKGSARPAGAAAG